MPCGTGNNIVERLSIGIMPSPDEQYNPTTLNSLKQRDPELVKSLAAFRSRIGDILLDSLGKLLADPRFHARHGPDVLKDLHAVGQVLRVLIQDRWTEQDLDTFDAYWRDAIRSDLFGEEFEAERHRIQTSVETARTKLLESEMPTQVPTVTQRTLW